MGRTVTCYAQKPRVETLRILPVAGFGPPLTTMLPVSWMTSYFHKMARGVGIKDMDAVLQQVVKIFNVSARGHAV